MIRRLSPLFAALALVVLIGACGGGDGGDGDGASRVNQPIEGAPEVEVIADHLEFDPDEFTVEAGDFNVSLTSEDQFHDFAIEDVDGLVEASSGDTEVGGFTIDDAGEYTFYCTVPGHRAGGMEGTLTVE
jgi:plastocyanin